jgi:hypothetical protein
MAMHSATFGVASGRRWDAAVPPQTFSPSELRLSGFVAFRVAPRAATSVARSEALGGEPNARALPTTRPALTLRRELAAG